MYGNMLQIFIKKIRVRAKMAARKTQSLSPHACDTHQALVRDLRKHLPTKGALVVTSTGRGVGKAEWGKVKSGERS